MNVFGNIDYMLQELERWGYNARRKDMPKSDSIIAKDRYMRSLSETANMLLNIGIPAQDIVKAAPFSRESIGGIVKRTPRVNDEVSVKVRPCHGNNISFSNNRGGCCAYMV